MSLSSIAQADVRTILNDGVTGVGRPITLTAPDGTSGTFTGWSNDIGLLVDPDTGQAVSGRIATIAISIVDLVTAVPPMALPVNVASAALKPWVVGYTDEQSNAYTFKVSESHPDRTLGIVTCTLEAYK